MALHELSGQPYKHRNMFLGNFEKVFMPDSQLEVGVHLVKKMMKEYGIPLKNIFKAHGYCKR